ncbi:MAG: ABC transporter ATP-binding protein [Muribaculaceae bacterium]|nr:ABC transporter ATP-binding protein [Muribaculaceae bacterium]
MSKKVLEVEGVRIGYGERTVLENVNFSLKAGSLAVIIGPNGSGKSTLLRALTGENKGFTGNVLLSGESVKDLSQRNLARLRAVVATERNGGGALTVEETVSIGRFPYTGLLGTLGTEDKEAVRLAMANVGIADFANRFLGELSDGERQKVMIARALAQETPLMFLDEPTSFLDVAARIETMRMLRRLADAGKTILLSTHDSAAALAVADTVLVLIPEERSVICGSKQEIIASGVLDRVFARAGLRFDESAGDFR